METDDTRLKHVSMHADTQHLPLEGCSSLNWPDADSLCLPQKCLSLAEFSVEFYAQAVSLLKTQFF